MYCHPILQHSTISKYCIQMADTILSKIFVKEALAQENTWWYNIVCELVSEWVSECVCMRVWVCVCGGGWFPFGWFYLDSYTFPSLYHINVIKGENIILAFLKGRSYCHMFCEMISLTSREMTCLKNDTAFLWNYTKEFQN